MTVCSTLISPRAHFHIDCYRSSSPACSASCPNHGRKTTRSSPKPSSRDSSLRIPATPSLPRPHVPRPIGVGTPKKQGRKKTSQFRAMTTTTMSFARAPCLTITPPPRPSTFRGGGPPPKVTTATISTCGTQEAPSGRHTWTSIR